MTQLEIAPARTIDPRDQVAHIPGVDARCEGGLLSACKWPFCECKFPDRLEDE